MMCRLAIAALAATALTGGPARAQAPCTLKGRPIVASAVVAFDAARDGEAIATFTDQPVQLTLVPQAVGRAPMHTDGGFRVDGFVDPSAIPTFTTRNVAVVTDHVSIASGWRVRITGATADRLNIEMTAPTPIDQVVRATAACDAVSFVATTFRGATPPRGAQAWAPKKVPFEIRATANGPVIFTFTGPAAKDTLVFSGAERGGGSVHILLGDALVVDAWASLTDLSATADRPTRTSPSSPPAPATRRVGTHEAAPQLVRAARDAEIRRRASGDSLAVGTLSAGTEALVVETAIGWSNVLPVDLSIRPADGGGFWVRSSDLGPKKSPPPATPLSVVKGDHDRAGLCGVALDAPQEIAASTQYHSP